MNYNPFPEYGDPVHYDAEKRRWLYSKPFWENGELQMGWTVVHDTSPTLDANQEEFNSTLGERFGEWRKIASVPNAVLHGTDLNRAHNEGDTKWVSRFLNDSDNSKLRTFRGNV